MISANTRKSNRQLPRIFYRWHRRIGVSAALFLIWIVISGWLLNHSDSLNLAQHQIHNSTLARWYNLNAEIPKHIFVSQYHWLIGSKTLLLDATPLAISLDEPVGLAQTDNLIAIASNHELALFNSQREFIDKLSDSNLPITTITKLGNGCAGIVISDNTHIFSSDDGIAWKPCDKIMNWSSSQQLTAEQLKQIEPMMIPDISLEKIILDLHTGRFFGRYGAYVVDAIGGCLLLLALSGLWLFFKTGKRSN